MEFKIDTRAGGDASREEKLEAARTRMAELARRFLDRSEMDLAAMQGGLRRIGEGDTTAVGDIRHLAHRMVGTGATLGFEALSECAQQLEKLTEKCLPGTLPGDDARDRIACELDALQAELRKLRDS
jgi:HPt (histidine-containing phosphotransfer) domain-containing protein